MQPGCVFYISNKTTDPQGNGARSPIRREIEPVVILRSAPDHTSRVVPFLRCASCIFIFPMLMLDAGAGDGDGDAIYMLCVI